LFFCLLRDFYYYKYSPKGAKEESQEEGNLESSPEGALEYWVSYALSGLRLIAKIIPGLLALAIFFNPFRVLTQYFSELMKLDFLL
jgi:hypothetical protein